MSLEEALKSWSECSLPKGVEFKDKDGNNTTEVRLVAATPEMKMLSLFSGNIRLIYKDAEAVLNFYAKE